MREILFRGKSKRTGKFLYGGYFKHLNRTLYPCGDRIRPKDIEHLIISDGSSDFGLPRKIEYYEVDPETVGEWTGLVDRNGVKIFEGDIIACRHWSTDRTGEAKSSVFFTGRVRYSYGDFYLSGCCRSEYLRDFGDREVIGNIHDNPELLEGGKE